MAGPAYMSRDYYQQQQTQSYLRQEQYEYENQPRIAPFWCQARFDYQSQDPSALSFSRGDVIEVYTQLESGWWDGVLNNERGWFPSNYVVQLSDQEVERLLSQFESEPQAPRENTWDITGGFQDVTDESTLDAGSLWVPEVTSDGQIYYVHAVTGESRRDLPPDADSDTQSTPYTYTSTSSYTRSRSNSRASETTAADPREVAASSSRRRSGTPEPWIKRLADDGLTFFYVNPLTNETSWSPPSPSMTDKARNRSHSNATYGSNRESVISDTSDIHPFAVDTTLPHTHELPSSKHAESTLAESAALQLQEALLPSSSATFNHLVSETRAAIAAIWESAPNTGNLMEKVESAVIAIRKLLFRAGTLPSSSKMQEILSEKGEAAQSRVKITQRKLVTTLSKVVLAARAISLNPISGFGRVRQDASDLDECVINFAQEIERRDLAEVANQRLMGILVSAEGAAGVGIGLVGAGIGGGWKGFGFVPTTENAPQRTLSSSLITEFQDQEAILREKAEVLSTAYASDDNTGTEVRRSSRDFLSRLLIFVNALADTNVAQHVDVDSMPANLKAVRESPYAKSVHRARLLIRRLEALTQSIYDHGGVFLLAAQELNSAALTNIIPFMEQVGESVLVLEQLYDIGQEQATMLTARDQGFDYRASIDLRMSRINYPSGIGGMDTLTNSLEQELAIPYLNFDADGEDDVVDFGAALSRNGRPPHSAISNTAVRQLEFSPNNSDDYHGATNDVLDQRAIDAPGDSRDDVEVATTTSEEDPDEELGVGVDIGNMQPKGKTNKSKIEKFFGRELPYQLATAADSERPWYLKPDYPSQDLLFTNNHDDTIRAGTLPALVEHLTDHIRRDQNFIRTFMITFKSFATVNEIFDLLVARFNTALPEGLTEGQREEWVKVKKTPSQVRVINIMKQLILDEELLDNDEKLLVAQKIKDFALSVQDELSAAKLLIRLADRSLVGEDTVVLTQTGSPTHSAPMPILPKTTKKLKLMDIDSLEMARQLTIMESDLYKQIRAIDCLNRAKEQKGKNTVSDHISAIIDHTNKVTMWINQQILERDDSRKRAAVIKYFIAVAERCHMLKNYSTMAALVSALNTPPIRRLKRTWQQVGARVMASLESSEKLFESNKNFNNYRQELQNVPAPCVPFLGVYLTTLIYIQEGSKDILPPPDPPRVVDDQPLPPPTGPLINFAKRQKAAETIREIKAWQSKPYQLMKVGIVRAFIEENLNTCTNVDEMSEQFWTRSLDLEPRERDDERMARLLQESGFL